LRDEQYNEVDRDRTSISLPPKALPKTGELWYPSRLEFSPTTRYSRVAVNVEETGSGRSTSYWSTFGLRDFSRDTAISDILFCSKIEPTERNSPFNRGALEVIPHPRCDYRVSDTIPVYFELYNLDTDDLGLSSYVVEYWVVPTGSSEETDTYAASSFVASAHGSDVPVNISIDTSNLWEDDWVFHVKITDQRTLFTAEHSAIFHLVVR
jgi:hypothetical protein